MYKARLYNERKVKFIYKKKNQIKNYLDVYLYPSHNTSLGPCNYHFFWLMQSAPTGICFILEQAIRYWHDSFLSLKMEQQLQLEIHVLLERWEKAIATDGQNPNLSKLSWEKGLNNVFI